MGLLGNLGEVEVLGLSVMALLSPSAAAELPRSSPAQAKQKQSNSQQEPTQQGGEEEAAEEGEEGEEEGEEGEGEDTPPVPLYLCPVPESVVPAAVVAAAMGHARDLADKLGVQGLAKLDAYMCMKTGQLVLIEMDPAPLLSPDSPLFAQALHHPTSPRTPDSLLREVINLAMMATHSDAATEDVDSPAQAPGLDEETEAELEEFARVEDAFVEVTDEDDTYDTQSKRMGGGDDPVYVSSSGRANRRGPTSRAAADYEAGSFDDAGMGQTEFDGGVALGDGQDIDGRGQGAEDAEYQDNWRL
ncbi:hypothetical protein QJQ45_030135 [Haematococcus lacustris]|nr:hypothetical protein QJQ45_030135 [Haematococcus lacustris]